MSSKIKILIAAVFLFSLAVRLTIFLVGGYHSIAGDEANYWQFSHGLLRGHTNTRHFLPTWPMAISLILKFGGSAFTVRIFTIVLGSFSSVLIFLIAQRQFGLKCGLLAACLHILSPEQAFFAHYIYAEIALELILLALTFLCFDSQLKLFSPKWLCALAFLWGGATLFKHFAVVGFLSFMGALLLSQIAPKKMLVALIGVYAVPLLMYSAILGLKGKNPLMMLNGPLISMRTWETNQIQEGRRNISSSTKHLIRIVTERKEFFIQRFLLNSTKLWNPNRSYVINRVARGNYSDSISVNGTIMTLTFFQVGFLILGVAGCVMAASSVFRTYSILSILLLTSMSATFFMVTRYRVPFMFHFIIFTAHALMRLVKTTIRVVEVSDNK